MNKGTTIIGESPLRTLLGMKDIIGEPKVGPPIISLVRHFINKYCCTRNHTILNSKQKEMPH